MPAPPKKSNVIPFPRRPAPPVDVADYQDLLAHLTAEHRPATTVERALVEMMARQYCLMQRSILQQQEAFAQGTVADKLPALMRQQTAADRAFHEALDSLIAFRRSRRT